MTAICKDNHLLLSINLFTIDLTKRFAPYSCLDDEKSIFSAVLQLSAQGREE